MNSFEDLYCFLKRRFGEDIVIDLDVMEYLSEPEIHGRYRGIPIEFRGLYSKDLTMDYDGDERTLEFELIPVVSEYMEAKPLFRFDVTDFETLKRRFTTVEWTDKIERLDELKENPVINNTTIASNIKKYERDKQYSKNRENV